MPYKEIAKLIPTMQSMAMLGENVKSIKTKNKKPNHFIKTGVKNLVGIELIKSSANAVKSL